jgi:hypothetical protein
MKTTVEISARLLDEARRLAAREGTTLRALIEEGLRRIVAERKRTGAFRLRRSTFKGDGLQSAVAGSSWDRLREMAYEGRGG